MLWLEDNINDAHWAKASRHGAGFDIQSDLIPADSSKSTQELITQPNRPLPPRLRLQQENKCVDTDGSDGMTREEYTSHIGFSAYSHPLPLHRRAGVRRALPGHHSLSSGACWSSSPSSSSSSNSSPMMLTPTMELKGWRPSPNISRASSELRADSSRSSASESRTVRAEGHGVRHRGAQGARVQIQVGADAEVRHRGRRHGSDARG